MQKTNLFRLKSLILVALYLEWGLRLTETLSVTSFDNNPCSDYTVNGCIIDEGMILETVLDTTEHVCQSLCSIVYAENCKFFTFDSTSMKCELVGQELDDYIHTCEEVAAPPSPSIEACLSSDDPCKGFTTTSCEYKGDTFLILSNVITLVECQEACQLFNPDCGYFRYSQTNNECELYESSERDCEVFIGPQDPPFEECTTQTTTSSSSTSSITSWSSATSIASSSSTTESLSTTTSLYTTTTPTTEGWKVFVVGGYNNGNLRDVEKVDPMKDDTNCNKPEDYPVKIDGSIAEMIGDQSIISCGGYDGTNNKYSSECYECTQKSSNWSFVTNMLEERRDAASVLLGNDQMWITGGYNLGSLKSTEFFDVQSELFTNGPDLPQPMWYHCMTKVNETHVFIGGYGSKTSYLVDTGKEPFEFKMLPEMSQNRQEGGCGVVNIVLNARNHLDNKKTIQSGSKLVIVVAGGSGRADTELFVVEDEKWIEGPFLPRGFRYGGSGNINENSMIVAGGKDEDFNDRDDIIMFNPTTMEFETLPGKLEMPRSSFGMTILTDNEDC